MLFVFPRDYFDHKFPEEMFFPEFDVANMMNEPICLIDYDALLEGKDPFPRGYDAGNVPAVWRGWQMTSNVYKLFHTVAIKHGVRLITSPDRYDVNHHLNLSYPRIREHTARSYFSSDPTAETIADVFATLGSPVFVKDSVKGHYFHPCILDAADASEASLDKVRDLIEDRGDSYSGVIVFREFREYEDETRFVIVDGRVVCSGAHNSSGRVLGVEECVDAGIDLTSLGAGSSYYTVDVAIDAKTGKPEVVEMGDGQVSEVPEGGARELVHALAMIS